MLIQSRADFYRAMPMHSADYAVARCLSVCPSVRTSHADILSICHKRHSLRTDKWNEHMNRQTKGQRHRVKPSFLRVGLNSRGQRTVVSFSYQISSAAARQSDVRNTAETVSKNTVLAAIIQLHICPLWLPVIKVEKRGRGGETLPMYSGPLTRLSETVKPNEERKASVYRGEVTALPRVPHFNHC